MNKGDYLNISFTLNSARFIEFFFETLKIEKGLGSNVEDNLLDLYKYIQELNGNRVNYENKIKLQYNLKDFMDNKRIIYHILELLQNKGKLLISKISIENDNLYFYIKNLVDCNLSKYKNIIKEELNEISNFKKDEKNEIYLKDNIVYIKDTYTFKNTSNNAIYTIPDHYGKFLDILILNKGKSVKYDNICKYIIENDISDGTYKGNLLKLLRKESILGKKEDIILGKNRGYTLL